MALIVPTFIGEIPRLHPRFLPPGAAQSATNCRFEDGAIKSFRRAREDATVGTLPAAIYKAGATWLTFTARTNVVPAPIAEDRLYYTTDGDGAFVRIAAGTVYPLALPAPVAAPSVVMAGVLDNALAQSVVYAYTWVTSLGEESPPSPLSAAQDYSPGMTATVGTFSTTPSGRGITHRRIYRSQTTASGITALFFVTQIAIGTTSYVHDAVAVPLNEPIPSTDFDPPPADLRGLVALANGILAGFEGKNICFSEPYVPHAWPIKYRLAVDSPIVGLAAFGQSMAVMTEGRPYIVQGSTPGAMVQSKIEDGLPCLSRDGIANFGYAAAYPSHRGLVMISNEGARVITEGMITPDEWAELQPETFIAAHHDGNYYFGFPTGVIDDLDGRFHDTDFSGLDLVDGGTPSNLGIETVDYDGGTPFRTGATLTLGVIWMTGPQPFLSRLGGLVAPSPVSLWRSDIEGRLYFATSDNRIMEFDARSQPEGTYVWRSALYVSTFPRNYAGILIQTSDPVSFLPVETKIIADGVQVFSTPLSNAPVRLPGGFLAQNWEIEIEGRANVTRLVVAESYDQLMQVQ